MYGHARRPALEQIAEVFEIGVATGYGGLAARQVGHVGVTGDDIDGVWTPFLPWAWLDGVVVSDLDAVRIPYEILDKEEGRTSTSSLFSGAPYISSKVC